MNLLPQFFYAMVDIGSLSMVGDGGGRGGVVRALAGRWQGVGRALAGRWEGVRRELGGRWRVVRVRAWSLIYRQIKSLHCSGIFYIYSTYIIKKLKFYNNPQSSKYLSLLSKGS